MKRTFLALTVFALSSCGAAYISSDLAPDDQSVTIVQMTTASTRRANSSSYVPRQLPAVFSQSARPRSGFVGIGASPSASSEPELRPASIPLSVPPSTPATAYQIGVGDVLLLATKSSGSSIEELSGLLAAQNTRRGYTVQDDGAIAIPDVGRLSVSSLTLEEAEARVFQRLVENGFDPSFSLEIAEFNSKRASIGGSVRGPRILPITLTPLTLSDAIALAGGVSNTDLEYTVIRFYRGGSIYQIPFERYLGDPSLQSIRIEDNDSVFVDSSFELTKAQQYFEEQIKLAEFQRSNRAAALSQLSTEVALRRNELDEIRSNFETRLELGDVERDFVYLTGEFNDPGRFPLPFGSQATLADAVYGSGGFSNETANPSQIYVLRGAPTSTDPDAVVAWHLDASVATNIVVATKFEMRPNDVVFIAEQPITRWNRVVQQIVPSLITSGAAIATR